MKREKHDKNGKNENERHHGRNARFAEALTERRIDAPRAIALRDFDPNDTHGLERNDAEEELANLQHQLEALQELFYAAGQQSVLVVLQGMDTAGKDGTVKHVMGGVNPTGCQVWSFKAPTTDELAHDFLWRIHRRTPERGMLTIFNRSHYEDVLVARVHGLVSRKTWEQRYEQINHFERLLAQNDTIILKFFLHISKDEQEQRLLAREDDPTKSWKLAVGDWRERSYWADYQRAYEDALGQCAAAWAPWYVVPANKKWYRSVFVARVIVDRLERERSDWERALNARGERERAALAAYRNGESSQSTG